MNPILFINEFIKHLNSVNDSQTIATLQMQYSEYGNVLLNKKCVESKIITTLFDFE